MILDLIRDYLNDNRDKLSGDPEHVSQLRSIIVAEKARRSFLTADPRMAQAFIRIERVASAEPVSLFGHPVPSHAFNRIEIFQGADDPETGDRVSGARLMSMLISEGDLTNLMMRQNRGDSDTWITLETAGEFELGPYVGKQDDLRLDLEERLVRSSEAYVDRVPRIAEKLKKARLPLTIKGAEELMRALGSVDMGSDLSFHVELHHEALSGRMVDMQVEATHTVANMHRIMAAREQMLLAPPEPRASRSHAEFTAERQCNPALNSCSGKYDKDQAAALSRVIEWGLDRIASDNGITGYDSSELDPHARRIKTMLVRSGAGQDIIQMAESLCNLQNSVSNPHILSARAETTPWMLTASVSQMSAGRDGLHSDFSRAGSDIVSIRFGRGHESDDHGSKRLRDLERVIELRMTPEEFMTAVRGHPTGEPVRCTINWAFGQSITPAPYRSSLDVEIEKANADMKAITSELRDKARQISGRIACGVPDSETRSAILDDLAELEAMSRSLSGELQSKALEAADAAEDILLDQYRKNIESIRAALSGDDGDFAPLLGG